VVDKIVFDHINTAPGNDTLGAVMNILSLREGADKYNLLMELSEDGIIIVHNGIIKESNSKMAHMCGYSNENLLDNSLVEFIHPEDVPAVEALWKNISNNGNHTKKIEAKLKCKNEQHLAVKIYSARCLFQQKPAALFILKVISQDHDEQASLEANSKLDSIAALSGGIAHDYNNLLTGIIGNITLAQTYLNQEDKSYTLLDHALIASKTAKNLTQKLITFSKGGIPNKEIAAVDGLVKSATDFTLSGSNIQSSYDFAPNLKFIDVDQSQIGQAIYNVVINAREAMPNGGVIKVSAKNVVLNGQFPSLKEGNYVKISIADQGRGIAESEFQKIFDPYYSSKELGNQKGMGLGLSICRSIIEKHSGAVNVESQLGFGTTLNLYLPAADEKSLAKKKSIKTKEKKRIFGEGRILVMDDEPMIRRLAGDILRHLGYEVEFAEDGAEAVALYSASMQSANPFDAVILDLTVRGGMGGKEAIQELLAINPNVKGIVSSGYSKDPGMTDYRQHGFSGVVAKPYTVREMGATLSTVLDNTF
jgi:PAS domain S-box-containing protein